MVSPPKEERAILESFRQGTAPRIVKRQASRGTIPVAAEELLEILILLTSDHDPTCSETAKKTLASWPVEKCAQALAAPDASPEVLAYFASQKSVPDSLVSAIANHANADDHALAPLAPRLSLQQIEGIAASQARLGHLPGFVKAVLTRPDLPAELRQRLEALPRPSGADDPAQVMEALSREEEHEAHAPDDRKRERISLTQKVARLSVSERVQVALKGTKDERLLLVRDPSKVVYRAVLASPKLGDSEVENFASMKNIAEEALRILGTQRSFLKNYGVVRNLVNNPRTPLDVSLGLLNRFTDHDLKYLTKNRNVPETLRNMALKLHKTRSSSRGGSGGGH